MFLVALAAVRIVSTYTEMGITWDEPTHVASGLQYLANHVLLASEHPPLARMMAALAPYLSGVHPPPPHPVALDGVEIIYQGGHPARNLVLIRLGILPFFLLAALSVFLWAKRHFDNIVASIATALFTMLPAVLAHAGLATTDMALTGCLIAAFFSLLVWAEQPGLQPSVLLGLTTGLAVISKFTALGFFPVAAVSTLILYLAVERPSRTRLLMLARKRMPPFLLAVLVGAVVIWAAYLFSFDRIPAPQLFAAIGTALSHQSTGHVGYLLGDRSASGWWYYFPIVLAVKTPIGFLLLLILGTGVCWYNRSKLSYGIPLAFSLGILISAMTSHVNIGVRHILPMYAGFSIVAALGLAKLLRWAAAGKLWPGALAAAVILWIAASTTLQHPNYLAYFNEIAGEHPEQVLVDSDLDWGQDTVRLARRLRQLGVDHVSFETLNLNSENLERWPGLPPSGDIDLDKPLANWTVVSPSMLVLGLYQHDRKVQNREPWFGRITPVERVGALLLYYVPSGR